MPLRDTRRDSGSRFRQEPVGGRGIDLNTSPELVAPGTLAVCRHARTTTRAVAKRAGAKKISLFTGGSYSIEFGDDAKYGKVTSAAQLRLPKGGFVVRFHFTAERPDTGKTAFLWSNRQNGQTYGVIWPTISDAGVFKMMVRWSSGTTTTLTTAALTNGGTYHGLLVYNSHAGTLTIYLNGASAASASPGSGLQPNQTTGIDWYFGAEWDPATPGVTADTHFDGLLDDIGIFALRGQDVTVGSPSLLDVLLATTFQTWPLPADPRMLAHYDFDDGSGTTVKDRTRYKNHMVLTGSPTFGAEVALKASPVNLIGVFERPDASRENIIAVGGTAYHETTKGATP